MKRRRNPPMHWRKLRDAWSGMRARCSNQKRTDWPRYGGRGISVDVGWSEFEAFYHWALQGGYQPGLTLDRIDNDANYGPANCRWATRAEQSRNRSDTVLIEVGGEKKCLEQWARGCGIRGRTLREGLDRGWPVEVAVTLPRGAPRPRAKELILQHGDSARG